MTIHYAQINSDSGPFVFIRLPDLIDDASYDIRGWARELSVQHFSGLPVCVHNHDEHGEETNITYPTEFASVVAGMSGAGVGLSTLPVSDPNPR